jgi:hypothetical protein
LHWIGSEAKLRKNSTLLRIGIVALTTAVGAVWLWHEGPIPVIIVTTPSAEFAPYWYMLSAFPVLGILLADLNELWHIERERRTVFAFASEIALLVLLSNARLAARIPISGHTLVMSYCLLRNPLPQEIDQLKRYEFGLILLMLLMVCYLKLAWWHDPITLLTGVAAGTLLAMIGRMMQNRVQVKQQ